MRCILFCDLYSFFFIGSASPYRFSVAYNRTVKDHLRFCIVCSVLAPELPAELAVPYASSFAFAKRKLYAAADGKLVLVSSDGDEVVISRCEFADWYDEYADTKILQRLRLRCEVA